MTKSKKDKAKITSLKDITKYDVMLPSYSLVSIAFRVIFSFLVTVIIIQLVAASIEETPQKLINYITYLRTALVFFLLGEVLIVLDGVFEYFLPFPKHIRKRLAIQLFSSLLAISIYFYISVLTTNKEESVPEYITYFGLGLGFAFVILYSSGLLVTRMTQKWVLSQKQIEEMEQEKIKMDYDALQEQLNPNFLFNNLSTLKSLIMYNKEAATKFTDNFTDVYRYALQSKKENLVPLEKELEFIKSYISLHKERLGEGVEIIFELDNLQSDRKIVPRTLQLLIENAIRHNIVDKELPLKIKISTQDDNLIVENNINLRTTNYRSKQGIIKLTNRYRLLTVKKIQVLNENGVFKVIIPLVLKD